MRRNFPVPIKVFISLLFDKQNLLNYFALIIKFIFRTFEDIRSYISDDVKVEATPELRRITAVDHPYPISKA